MVVRSFVRSIMVVGWSSDGLGCEIALTYGSVGINTTSNEAHAGVIENQQKVQSFQADID